MFFKDTVHSHRQFGQIPARFVNFLFAADSLLAWPKKFVSSLKIISKQSEDHVNLHLKVKCSKCLLRKIFSMSRNGSAHFCQVLTKDKMVTY